MIIRGCNATMIAAAAAWLPTKHQNTYIHIYIPWPTPEATTATCPALMECLFFSENGLLLYDTGEKLRHTYAFFYAEFILV